MKSDHSNNTPTYERDIEIKRRVIAEQRVKELEEKIKALEGEVQSLKDRLSLTATITEEKEALLSLLDEAERVFRILDKYQIGNGITGSLDELIDVVLANLAKRKELK